MQTTDHRPSLRDLRRAARARPQPSLERLGSIAHRPIEATVVFDADGPLHTAELRLHVARGEVLVARGEGEDHRTALDRAEDKLRRQLEKASASRAARRPSQANPLVMLRLRDFLARRGDPLQLEALTGELGLDRQLPDAEVAGPGLALAGYTGRFAPNRLHVFGRDRDHLPQLAPGRAAAQARWSKFFEFELPCIFVTKGQEVPAEMLELAQGPRRAAAPQQAQDGGVLSPASSRSSRKPSRRAPPCTAPWPTSTASVCSSSGAPASARASACSTWSSGATAWWPTTWCR